MIEKIVQKYEIKQNPYSSLNEYHYKRLVICYHSLKRFEERFNYNKFVLLALVIKHYNTIIKSIDKNKNKLSDYKKFIDIYIFDDVLNEYIGLTIRKDQVHKGKYIIKTIKILNYH